MECLTRGEFYSELRIGHQRGTYNSNHHIEMWHVTVNSIISVHYDTIP